MPKANVHELYDLDNDVHEKNDIAEQHPEIVKALKRTYDAWWEDIQPHMVNDHLPTVPEACKPYHELYRRDFGQQRYDEAMQLMTWTGGKPYGPPRKKRKRD